jgi:hypothetical protein
VSEGKNLTIFIQNCGEYSFGIRYNIILAALDGVIQPGRDHFILLI